MSDRIPSEFVGRARAFRNRIMASEESFVSVQDAIYSAFQRRLQRKPSFRQPECIDLLRHWQSSDKLFGQPPGHTAKMDFSKKRVEIIDFRLLSITTRKAHWAGDARESGVDLTLIRLIGEHRGGYSHVERKLQSIASFSLHALARYYQRAFRPSDDALVMAIWGVITGALALITGDQSEFSLPVPDNGGNWWGRMVTGYVTDFDDEEDEGEPEPLDSLDIRTFYTDCPRF
jgi:hypothetical protein